MNLETIKLGDILPYEEIAALFNQEMTMNAIAEQSRLVVQNGRNQIKSTTGLVMRNGWQYREMVLVSDTTGEVTVAWDVGMPYPIIHAIRPQWSTLDITAARDSVAVMFDRVFPGAGIVNHPETVAFRDVWFRNNPMEVRRDGVTAAEAMTSASQV